MATGAACGVEKSQTPPGQPSGMRLAVLLSMEQSITGSKATTRWLQVFDLRVAPHNVEWVEHTLRELGRETHANAAATVRVYRHTEVETDFSVHVTYSKSVSGRARVELGDQLHTSLGELGSVYASSWKELREEASR